MELVRPTHVEARSGYRIYLEYADGVHGEIDLSDLAGKGIFAPWLDPRRLQPSPPRPRPHHPLDQRNHPLPRALYLELTGKSLEEGLPQRRSPGGCLNCAASTASSSRSIRAIISPPHFHAKTSDSEILIAISTQQIIAGNLPPRLRREVVQWAALRQLELEAAWEAIRRTSCQIVSHLPTKAHPPASQQL